MENDVKKVLKRVKLNKNFVLRFVMEDEITVVKNGVDDPYSSFLKYPSQRKAHKGYKKNLKQKKLEIKDW